MVDSEKKERWYISYPKDVNACRLQRREVNRMIDACTPVERAELDAIVGDFQTSALEMCSHLANLAAEYLPLQLALEHQLRQIVHESNKHTDLLDAIKADWQSVKLHQLLLCQQHLTHKNHRLSTLDGENSSFQGKTDQKAMKILQVRKQKTLFYSTTLSFLVLGLGCAEDEVNHAEEEEWFEGGPTKGENFHFKTGDPVEDEKNGLYRARMRSDNGCNLHVDVHLTRKECDLPATVYAIRSKQEQRKQTIHEVDS
jgi:hypothetical protein